MRYYYFTFLAVVSLLLPISAQTVSIAPTGYRITVEPNSSERVSFTVSNTSNTVLVFTTTLVDGTDTVAPSPIADWITVPAPVTLAPGASTDISLAIFVPATAIPGDRYVYVIVREQVPDDQTAFTVLPAAGVPLTITVAGEIDESVRVLGSTLGVADRGVTGAVALQNSGDIEVPVQGTLEIFAKRDHTEVPVAIRLRAGATSEQQVSVVLSGWYVGPVRLQGTLSYGLLNEQIQISERIFMVGVYVQRAIGAGIVTLLISLMWVLSKRHNRGRYVEQS